MNKNHSTVQYQLLLLLQMWQSRSRGRAAGAPPKISHEMTALGSDRRVLCLLRLDAEQIFEERKKVIYRKVSDTNSLKVR